MLLVAMAALAIGCAPATPEVDTEAMIAGANALDAAFVAAVNAGDAEAMGALYASDSVSFPPDALVALGHDAIREGARQMLASMPGAQLELSEKTNTIAGEFVITWGMFRLNIPGPEGADTVLEGRFTDIKAERDGKWVYVHDHASMPLAPPAE